MEAWIRTCVYLGYYPPIRELTGHAGGGIRKKTAAYTLGKVYAVVFIIGKKKTGTTDVGNIDPLCVHSGRQGLGKGSKQSGAGRRKKVDGGD